MESRDPAFVPGQRYSLAAVASGLALLSFLNVAGIEEALRAIFLGVKALKRPPQPALKRDGASRTSASAWRELTSCSW